MGDKYDEMTKVELLDLAREQRIKGRSGMDADELKRALRGGAGSDDDDDDDDGADEAEVEVEIALEAEPAPPPVPKGPPPVEQMWRLTNDVTIVRSGIPSQLKAGRVVSSAQYDLAALKRAGGVLQLVTDKG